MALRVAPPLLMLLALSAPSLAAPPAPAAVPLHIDFAAPAGCSTVGAFYARVLARTDRARRAKVGEKGPRFRVRLTRAGTRVHGELSAIADRGDSNTRKVDGESCREVVEVLSLTVALALDPAAGPAVSSSSSSSSSPSPSPSSPSSPLSPSPTAPAGSAPSPSVAPAPVPTPVPPAPPTPSVTPVAPAIPAPAPAPPPASGEPPVPAPPPAPAEPSIANVSALTARPAEDQPPRTYAVDLGLRGVVANVVSPYVSLGGALSLLVAGRRGEEVPQSLGIAFMYVPNDLLLPSPDVVVRWTALALTACPPWGFRGRFQVQPCLLGIGGWLAATERAVTNPLSAGRTWWSTGALVRSSFPLGRGFSIDLDLGISVPLVKRRFIITAPDTTVGETPPVSALAGIGVSLGL